jgi:hypothetical protein
MHLNYYLDRFFVRGHSASLHYLSCLIMILITFLDRKE